MKKRILIVGGTSGIGLELARHYVSDGHTVCITGRHGPKLPDAQYHHWSIDENAECMARNMDELLSEFSKVLVAAPAGTQTPFWRSSDQDCTGMLDAAWVSEKIVELSSGVFKYKYAHILRNPARVEIIECLDQQMLV